jgi:hypothetical protein
VTAQVVRVLVGLQAAGKSTFARTVLPATAVIVSKDDFPNARRRQAPRTGERIPTARRRLRRLADLPMEDGYRELVTGLLNAGL